MSGIAEVLLNLGYKVSGSDLRSSDITSRLNKLGGEIYINHSGNNLSFDVSVVVISSAVRDDNPEVLEAKKRLIPVIPRAEMLAELMRMKYGIAVAGTHGKTTTTSMVATVLAYAGMDPTVVIGGKLNSLGSNAKLGQGEFLVAEADESDGSFLKLTPTIAIVTNIDNEHLDFYSGIEEIKETFLQFANKVPFYGVSILCLDDGNIQAILPGITKRFTTYGFSTQSDIQAKDIELEGLTGQFNAYKDGKKLGKIKLRMPGIHNVSNSLAVIAAGLELGLPFKTIQAGLAEFSGVQRRFQIKGESGGITVIDDYGHHPTEIKATLAAAKNAFAGEVTAIFQPHRYTRTKELFNEFLTAFYDADRLIVTDIYAASEDKIEGVSAELLVEGIKKHGHKDVAYAAGKEKAVDFALKQLKKGDVLITLGAGDIWQAGEKILARLNG